MFILQILRSCRSAEFVRWVTESNRPFVIVNDRGFRSLMKTGRPDYYIPSAATLSRDVKNVFVRVRGRIAKGLKVRCAILILRLKGSPSTLGVRWQAQLCH